MSQKLNTMITVDVKGNENGTYDAYIATECSSGSHYLEITADKIGEYVADLIESLDEQ